MSKEDLEALIARIRALPPEKLEEVEEVLEWLERRNADVYMLSDEERSAIRRGLDDAANGRFASQEDMDEIFGRASVPGE